MKRRRVIILLAALPGAAALAATVSTVSVIMIDTLQMQENAHFVAAHYPDQGGSGALVAYFSRSGNTEIMAMEIARAMHARTIRLLDESYRIGFWGWVNALRDARQTEASITPSAVDLTPYETVYIGSPIWLYSPAPPVWAFVDRNDFSGKRVVLFTSMNSRFEQKYIDEFADLVRRRGGVFLAHIYIIRGRMTRQMTVDAFLTETRRLAKTI